MIPNNNIILVLIFVFLIITIAEIIMRMREKIIFSKLDNISQISFQRFARFYGEIVLSDDNFNNKISKILEAVNKNKERDINKIADFSGCTYDECILKIRYLKKKRKINDYYYVDYENGIIKPCSEEDRKLIIKYRPYILKHCSVEEIARKMPNARLDNLDEIKEQILNELDYLDAKNLVNELNIDKVDKKIIYYTVEKHKKEKDYISIDCESCGALNDVPRNGKTKCEYCDRIIEDKSIKN